MQQLAQTINSLEEQMEIHNNNIKRRGLKRDVTNSHGFVNDYVLREEYSNNVEYQNAIEHNVRLCQSFLQNYPVSVIKYVYVDGCDATGNSILGYAKIVINDK
jgi:hypothetical protein